MHVLPVTIENAITAQLLTPLVEVLTGQRPARDIEAIVADDVALRLALRMRKPLGPVEVRTLLAQPVASDEALELTAIVTDRTSRTHPLGVRITRVDGRATITAVATDLWGF